MGYGQKKTAFPATVGNAVQYKLIELLLVGAISAPLSLFLFPQHCVLPSCGPAEAFGGMMFGYIICSIATGYFVVTGAAFYLTSRLIVWLQASAMATISCLYVVVALTLLMPAAGNLIWIAAGCLGLSALGSTVLTRRMADKSRQND